MRRYPYAIAGDPVQVYVPEDDDDLRVFLDWVRGAAMAGPVAVDTETSGLDIYRPGYQLRTVQFGDRNTGYVIHWERGGRFHEAALIALRNIAQMLIHNAPFDWLVLDKHAGVSVESLAPRTVDTKIKATLRDPRAPMEGGLGTGLKPLSGHFLDPAAPDTQGDLTAVFRSMGLTKANGFANIPLQHDTYNLYAGLDVILTARIDPVLTAELDRIGVRPALVQYEHEIARMCSIMQRTGLVLDTEYTVRLRDQLRDEQDDFTRRAAQYGVANVNSTAQIAEALLAMGERLTERTASGAWKVDKAVLSALADMSVQGDRLGVRAPNPLAEAVIRSKRAGKWATTYADTFLSEVDANGRIHANINTLAARTGRMSVTKPAVQTLPSSDWMIRRCLLADEGHVMGSTDFQAIEMRVLAALAGVRKMTEGFVSGGDDFDIHMYTAQLVKGPDATQKHRKVFKGAGFGKVYGGGVATIARQTGASEDEIRQAVAAYDREFPEIKRMSNRWQREARQRGWVHVSVTGRQLPLDPDRAYAVVNYACQSAARDCLGQSMLNAEEAGLLPYLRLPVHDEFVWSAPAGQAEEISLEIEKSMTFDLFGVPIVASSEIGGRSWGSLYGADF